MKSEMTNIKQKNSNLNILNHGIDQVSNNIVGKNTINVSNSSICQVSNNIIESDCVINVSDKSTGIKASNIFS